MKLPTDFFTSTTGQWVLLAVALFIGAGFVTWQHYRRQPILLSAAQASAPAKMPRVFTRDGSRFPEIKQAAPSPRPEEAAQKISGTVERGGVAKSVPLVSPLTVFSAAPTVPTAPSAPFGRMIPCETVTALESNRIETPVVGLVTDDVWHDGRLVIPAGAEVHGRASLDRTRERIAANGPWIIVWRTSDRDNGTELAVQGLALDREIDASGQWYEYDGSAGLRGTVVRTQDDRELRLFAATFLAAATAALQDTRTSAGPFGETSLPSATVRNATLAGTGAILREHAQQIRDSIAKDGFYLRVPAGKTFYLYVTQTIDRSQARHRAPQTTAATAPSYP